MKKLDEVSLPETVTTFARVISKMQEYSGTSSTEILFGIGEQIGRALSRRFRSADLSGLLNELAGVRLQLNLGEMDVQKKDPTTIKIYGCNGCVQMPDSEGKTHCPFGEGLIGAILQERLGLGTRVRMVESVGRGTGYNVCTFVLEE